MDALLKKYAERLKTEILSICDIEKLLLQFLLEYVELRENKT